MSREESVHDPWTIVDEQPDPARMVRMLEDRAAHPDQAEMRRRFWEWLEVRPGEMVLDVGCGAPLNLAFEVADATGLPFPDEGWDLVLAATVFTHVQRQTDVMQEMARVARRGGRVDGWSGRRILGLMRQAGLGGVRCLPLAWVDPDYGPYMRYTLESRAAFAVERCAVTEAEAKAWLDELDGRARDGTFFSGLTYYGFVGTK